MPVEEEEVIGVIFSTNAETASQVSQSIQIAVFAGQSSRSRCSRQSWEL